MGFKDLHIMQQAFLLNVYLESDQPPALQTEGCVFYVDEKNKVIINQTKARVQCKVIWLPVFDGDIFVTFDISEYMGMDKVHFSLSVLGPEFQTTIYDKYGISTSSVMTDPLDVEINKLKIILSALDNETPEALSIIVAMDKMLSTIEKIKELPDSFFDEISVDVPAQIIVSRLGITIGYELVNDKTKHRKSSPIMTIVESQTFLIESAKEDGPSMTVSMGTNGPAISLMFMSSTGTVEGGTFNVTTDDSAKLMVVTIADMMEQILNDCSFKDEIKPLYRKFMTYYKQSAAHVKHLCNIKGRKQWNSKT